MDTDTIARFNSRVRKGETCWVWTGRVNGSGYGVMDAFGTSVLAHRLSYLIHCGEIPDGLQIDHLCSNRLCVAPDHLEAVAYEENMRRSVARRRTCRSGHPYTPENIYVNPRPNRKDGERVCRTCNNQRVREYQQRKRAAKLP